MSENSNKTPGERAPLLLVFGDLAGRVGALVRARPILIARLINAPPEAVHSIGAYLHMSADATKPDATVADTITNTHPRDLLAAALPGCPAKLYRALARAGDRVRGREFYEGLGSISRTVLGNGLLASGALDEHRLAFYHAVSKMDPLITSLHGALGETVYNLEAINSLIAFLRAHNALNEGEFRLPARAGMASLTRRIQRALGRIPAPDPGFAPPPPFRIVTSTEELQSIGKNFGNCVAIPNYNAIEFHFRLLSGTGVFLVAEEPALLVALRRVGGGLWVLEQIAGPKNRAPTKDTQATLLRELADIGLKIVTTDPQAAFARIHHESQRRRTLPDGDEDDLGDDLDDGIGNDVEDVAA